MDPAFGGAQTGPERRTDGPSKDEDMTEFTLDSEGHEEGKRNHREIIDKLRMETTQSLAIIEKMMQEEVHILQDVENVQAELIAVSNLYMQRRKDAMEKMIGLYQDFLKSLIDCRGFDDGRSSKGVKEVRRENQSLDAHRGNDSCGEDPHNECKVYEPVFTTHDAKKFEGHIRTAHQHYENEAIDGPEMLLDQK